MAVIIPIYSESGKLEVSDNFSWFIDGVCGYLTENTSELITPISVKDNDSGQYFHIWHLRTLASSSYSVTSHLTFIRSQQWAKIGIEETFEC